MEYEFAGFWRRFVAMFIDGIILAIILLPLQTIIGLGGVHNGIYYLINLAVGIGYSAGCNSSKWQATIGKKVMGCYIINTDGTRMSFGKAVLRYFCYIISSLPLSLGYIWAGFDKRKRAFHDMIVGTYVVKE